MRWCSLPLHVATGLWSWWFWPALTCLVSPRNLAGNRHVDRLQSCVLFGALGSCEKGVQLRPCSPLREQPIFGTIPRHTSALWAGLGPAAGIRVMAEGSILSTPVSAPEAAFPTDDLQCRPHLPSSRVSAISEGCTCQHTLWPHQGICKCTRVNCPHLRKPEMLR